MPEEQDQNERENLGLSDDDLQRRPEPAREGEAVEAARSFAIDAARLMSDEHCEDLIIFDVRGTSSLTDFIIVGSGTSDRQMKAVAGHVSEMGRNIGYHRYSSERDDASTWVVMDFVDVMVHLFEPETRSHYDLEMMWGDCPKIDWQR